VKLAFLKEKSWPRTGPKPDEKLVQGSATDHLEEHCVGELMDAVKSKDVRAFRSALEALILNCFDEESDDE